MFSIETNLQLKLITVTYSGNVNVDERSHALDAVLPTINAIGPLRILLDFMDANVALDTFDSSKALARRLSDIVAVSRCRVAYLSAVGARVNFVIQALTSARGLTMERFNNRTVAIQWLLSDKPDQLPMPARGRSSGTNRPT